MSNKNQTVSVIGLGYIGLPTAALIATNGFMVNGMDVDVHAVKTINKGNIHIVEPDLDAYVRSAVINNKLKAHLTLQPADIYIICVPTPFFDDVDPPLPNLDYVKDAAENISAHLKHGDMVILESTSPVGTTKLIKSIFNKNGKDTTHISIAYCPERVLPGKIMAELVDNPRVIGGIDKNSTSNVCAFYKNFVNGVILETNSETAEMCKLTENSFRDVNIAFANELSLICDKSNVNVSELIQLANFHPRVNILQPGTGVGGHCIAVDPWFIVAQDPVNSKLIQAARNVNDHKPKWVSQQICEFARKRNANKIACLGLAFKPNIDDLRGSPSLSIIDDLINDGFEVSCVEPNIISHNKYDLISIDKALADFDVIAILVKHKEFSSDKVLSSLGRLDALDFCGLLHTHI